MTFQSKLPLLPAKDLAAYGTARARDIAFDAIRSLWDRRKEEGMKQKELAALIGRDAGWVSRCFRGPGNWTFQTFGALAIGLGGEIEIIVRPIEEPSPPTNFDAYEEFAEIIGTSVQHVELVISNA